jgi:hypothetical protein
MKCFTIIIILVFPFWYACDGVNSDQVYKRINSYINTAKKQIDTYSGQNTLKRQMKIFKDGENIEIDFSINIDDKMAKQLAEKIYSYLSPTMYKQYLPFYTVLYKKLWIIYGCRKIKYVLDGNWDNLGEWDEIIMIMDKETCQIYSYYPIIK